MIGIERISPSLFRMKLLSTSLLPLFLLAACGPESGPPPGGGGMPPAQVTLADVESRKLVEWDEFTGRIEAIESVELRPRVSGYITEVRFQAGAEVKKDEVLFTIDRSTFESDVRAAKAEVVRAEAAVVLAKQEYNRVEALLAARAIAHEQAEGRESMWRQSEAALEAAKAVLERAEIELDRTDVKAPIAGRISRALMTEGNFVTAGASVLTTIVSIDPVYAYADIDENSLLRLQELTRDGKLYVDETGKVPMQAQLADESDFPHAGHIESFDNRLDAATGSMVVRCVLPNPDRRLTPGLFTRVRLPMTAEHTALLIEAEAVLTDQANKYVLGVTPENITVYKPVVLGPMIDHKRIIREGLTAGDKVIVNGMARLPQPGMPVQPVTGAEGEGNPAGAPTAAPATTPDNAGKEEAKP